MRMLICTFKNELDKPIYTPYGEGMWKKNARAKYRIETFVDGLIEEQYLYLLDDDDVRALDMELAKAYQKLNGVEGQTSETELTGEEVRRTVRRVMETGVCRISDLTGPVFDAFQDITAGFSAYYELEIAVYAVSQPQARRRKSKPKRRK